MLATTWRIVGCVEFYVLSSRCDLEWGFCRLFPSFAFPCLFASSLFPFCFPSLLSLLSSSSPLPLFFSPPLFSLSLSPILAFHLLTIIFPFSSPLFFGNCWGRVRYAAGFAAAPRCLGWCSTLWIKKTRHETLAHNFTTYQPIFKILSLLDWVKHL